MKSAPLPSNESERVSALQALNILDTLPEQEYDDIVRIAAHILKTPISLVSLVDSDRQWFKAKVGLGASQTPREVAFCAHAILDPENVFVVEDAHADNRFADNPLVTAAPNVRFYAGAPLVMSDGLSVGTLCVIDHEARKISAEDREMLAALGRCVVASLELRRKVIAESKDREALQDFFDMAPDLICIAGADGFFKAINKNGASMLGFSTEELTAKPFFDFIHPDDQEKTLAEVKKLESGQPTIDFENRYQTKAGRFLPLQWRAMPKGEKIYATARDITMQKKQAQEIQNLLARLKSTNKDLEDFAYIVSHDLKAPLRGIASLADWLTQDYADKLDDEGKEHLKLLGVRVRRMHDLIEGILAYSSAGRKQDSLTEVDLQKMVGEIIESLSIDNQHAIKIQTPLPIIVCDRTKVGQVFQNLISNAVKYMNKEKGEISVLCEREAGGWRFGVKDNGPGIEPQYFERIFQIFQTLNSRDSYESTGIGLSIVKKIVEMLGGRVWVESVPGAGATFYFTVPDRNADDLVLGQEKKNGK